MKTPRDRASAIILFIGPASSTTRCDAPLHQWSSHMSQITNAVSFGAQETAFVDASPAFDRDLSCSVSAPPSFFIGSEHPARTAMARTIDRIVFMYRE